MTTIDRVDPDHLCELFACRTKAKLTAILRSYGLPAVPDALGWPIVLADDLRRVLSSQTVGAASRRKRPNLPGATM